MINRIIIIGSSYCILGDGRVSEQSGLTSLHTIFMREHNRIAEVLHRLNPQWNDEIIYQNTRKIFTAAYQHIVYNEFLPRILGWDAMDKYDLRLSSSGYYKSNYFVLLSSIILLIVLI